MSATAKPARGRPGPGGGGGPGGLGLPAEKAENFGPSFKRLVGRLRPERWKIFVVISFAVFSVGCSVAGPKLLGTATDVLFAGVVGAWVPAGMSKDQVVAALQAKGENAKADMLAAMDIVPGSGIDFDALGAALWLVVGVYVLSSIFSWVQGYVMAGVSQRVIYSLRDEVDRKLGRLPLGYFDQHARGDLLSRVTNDIDNINTTLTQTLTQAITSLTMVLGVLGMMIWISPVLALIALVTVPLSMVVTMMIAKRSQPQFAAQWKWTGKLNGHVEEMYSGHELVKVYGRQTQAEELFDETNERMYRASFSAQFISGIIMPAMTIIGNLGYVGIAVVGGLRVASGQISLGDVQAFIQYSRQFTMPITQLASLTNLLQSGVASAERVFAVLDEVEEEPDPVTPARLDDVRGHVEFDRISFRYEADKPLIENLSLEARPGQTVAIVGPTGAGKTTLVNLLMRFYELDGGRILLDGVDIRELTRDDLRHCFGMVLQDAWLFGGTIRDNIAYGSGSATEDDVLRAATAAHVDHFVQVLPDGYDTVLDDEASNVSAGERQLLTIARAFLSDPAILILDEATSSVDTRTEVLIQQAMARLRKGRTSFVIAHRLSTIQGADVILVLENGAVVEQGTHDELLARHGAYHALYTSQFTADPEEAVASR
ncbi:MAG: ATP-binding cassette, subfamily multidrug efflux pump [Actinomycetota bacterium]|nr:ATP-binding cassette, subfamily multidrug efflux pump [Actinomycetota bacterium]